MVEVIENGVTECEYKFEKGYSHVSLQIFTEVQKISNPIMQTILEIVTPTKKTATMTSLYSTGVV